MYWLYFLILPIFAIQTEKKRKVLID
jgi:hypothetical protein